MKNTKEESHSKERIDFQNRYIDMVVHTKPIGDIIEEYKSKMNKDLYELSDGQLIMIVENKCIVSNGVYNISQWNQFIEFRKHVEEEE